MTELLVAALNTHSHLSFLIRILILLSFVCFQLKMKHCPQSRLKDASTARNGVCGPVYILHITIAHDLRPVYELM